MPSLANVLNDLPDIWTFHYGPSHRTVRFDRSQIAVRAGRVADWLQAIEMIQAANSALRLSLQEEFVRRRPASFDEGSPAAGFSVPSPFFSFRETEAAKLIEHWFDSANPDSFGIAASQLGDLDTLIRNKDPRDWVRVPGDTFKTDLLLQNARDAFGLSIVGEPETTTMSLYLRFVVFHEPKVSKEDAEAYLAQNHMKLVWKLTFADNAVIAWADESANPVQDLISQVENRTGVFRRVEPVIYERFGARGGAWAPSSVDKGKEWQWQNNGFAGKLGADSQITKAWECTIGCGTRIAVVDNGMDVTHEGLAPAIEHGGSFQSLGNDIIAEFVPLTRDDHGKLLQGNIALVVHGTFCCGIAASREVLTSGVVGVTRGSCGAAPGARLIPVACAKDQCDSQITLARAIAFAADPSCERQEGEGADVISCSLGPTTTAIWACSGILHLALQFAATKGRGGKGCPIFWAASNIVTDEPVDIKEDLVVSHPHVLAIASSNQCDCPASGVYGEALAFVAPGQDVFSTTVWDSWTIASGNSNAAPLAAGVAALMLSVNSKLCATAVGAILKASCDRVGVDDYDPPNTGRSHRMGSGRINAGKAVCEAKRLAGR